MNMPARGVGIINELYAKNSVLANGTEDQRRFLTRMVAEQMRHELGINWGTKSTSSDAPQSKDGIAFKLSEGVMDVWDSQDGTTRKPILRVNQPPDYPSLTGQHFIEVKPINHLAVEPTNGGGDTDDGDEDDDQLILVLKQLKDGLDTVRANQAKIMSVLELIMDKPLQDNLEITFPEYQSNKIPYFGVVTLKPTKPKT